MLKQISLNLDDYKEKDLPLTITINGNTYHSGYALATAQTSYFEMGKAVGIEMGMEETKDNAYTDRETDSMHNHFFHEGKNEGWNDGWNEGYKEGFASGYKAAEEEVKAKLGIMEMYKDGIFSDRHILE